MRQISIIKKKEVVIWILILAVILVYWIGMKQLQKEGNSVIVSIGDKTVQTVSLENNQTIQIEGEGEYWVKLQIKDGMADVIEASCPDQICVNHYSISKEGESIVCLPAKIVIRVEEEKK